MSAIRALGRAGFIVTIVGDWPMTTGFWSRYAGHRLQLPDAADDSDGFGSGLLEYLHKLEANERPVLLCMEEPSLEWVVAHGRQLSGLVYGLFPAEAALTIARSKASTHALAEELGIPVPHTYRPAHAAALIDAIAAIPQEKLAEWLVKPEHGSGSSGIVYLGGSQMTDWATHWAEHGPCLLQQRLPRAGTARGVSLLFDANTHVVASFVHERLREYPVSGGPSTARVSVHDAYLLSESIRLMRALHWTGVAMIEWKLDPRSGTWYLLEINPRFWGSLELSTRAGVDFPSLYARTSMGETVAAQPDYADGIRCRWMLPGDILRYLTCPSDERESLREFLNGALRESEDWDKRDIRGSLSTVICQAMALTRPKFWKFLRR